MTTEPKRRGRPPRTEPRPPCTIEGCGVVSVAKGYCQTHYQRARRKSDLSKPIRQTDMVRVGGHLRVTDDCAAELHLTAANNGASVYQTIQTVLENWAAESRAKRQAAALDKAAESA